MRIAVTGAGGFVGPHLIRHLQSADSDAEIYGSVFDPDGSIHIQGTTYTRVDLKNYEATRQWLSDVQPDVIYHLAGQSSLSKALHAVWQTIETNVRIQLHIFQACIDLNIKPRILSISSGMIYSGGASEADSMPVDEQGELRPGDPYALSKATQDLMSLQYFLSHKLPVIRVRPFNHTGPGQRTSFVAPDFAMQVARIEAGLQQPVMRVGNLEAQRDFTDVRDVVRAYALLADLAAPGEAYNVSANSAYSIQSILDILLSYSDANIRVEIDPERFRPVDVPLVQGDNSRLINLTGWHPTIPLEQTLQDLLDDCRNRVQNMRSE